jgi:predicted nuclease of predicted toxin-antitoxin system
MKLLFDQNLSPRLVDRLTDLYPNTVHVQQVGLGKALDAVVRNYALQNGYIIEPKTLTLVNWE